MENSTHSSKLFFAQKKLLVISKFVIDMISD